MRRGVLWALIAAGVVAGVAVTALVLLSNRAFTTRVARDVIARLDEQIPADVTFSHVSVQPLRGVVAIDGLVLAIPGRNRAGRPPERFAQARQAIVDLDMARLLLGKVRITRLHLVSPQVTVIHRGGDRYNLQEMLPEPTPEEPQKGGSAVSLDRITIEGGRLTYRDDPRALMAELPHLDASLDLDVPREAVGGRVTLAEGWLRHRGVKHAIDSFLADVHKVGPSLRIDELRLDVGPTMLGGRGRIDGLGGQAPRLALEGLLKGELAALAAVPELARLSPGGRLRADFQLGGTTRAPRVAARITGEDLRARKLRVPRLTAAVVVTERELQVERADAVLWGGRLALSGTAPLAKDGRMDLALDAEGLDLAAAAAALELGGPAARLRGRAWASLSASGVGTDPRALRAGGWLRASGALPLAEQGRAPRMLPLAARTDLRWERGTLDVSRLDLSALGGRLVGAGRIAPLDREPAWAFRGRLDGLDLTALQQALARPLPVRGRVAAELDLHGRGFTPPAIAGGARVRAQGSLPRGEASNRVDVPLVAEADVRLDGRDLLIERLTGRAFDGAVAARGRVPLDGRRERLTLAFEGRGLDLAALDRAYELAPGPIAGRADARVRLEGARLAVERVEARTLGGVARASGEVRMPAAGTPARYDMDVELAGLELEPARKAWRLARLPLEGRADARLRVRGAGPAFRAEGPVHVAGRAIVPNERGKEPPQLLPVKIDGTIAASRRAVRLAPLRAAIGGSTLVARGTLDLDGRSEMRLDGRLTDTPAIARVFGLPRVQGGQAVIRGTAAGTPGELRFQADMKAEETRVAGMRFDAAQLALRGGWRARGELAIDGGFEARRLETAAFTFTTLAAPLSYRAPAARPAAGTLRLPRIDGRVGGGRVAGSASFALATRSYELALSSQGLTLGDLSALRREEVAALPAGTPVELVVSGRGTLAAPRAGVKLALGAFRHGGIAFAPTRVDARLERGALTVDGALFGDRARLRGRLPMAGAAGAGELELRLVDARLAPVFALLPVSAREQVELPVDGLLSGNIRLSGVLTDPARLRALVDLSKLRLTYDDLDLANQGPLRLRLADRRLRFEAFRLAGQGTDLGVRGVLGLGVASDLAVDGKLNLALLEKVAPRWFADASGRAVIDGQLRGTLGEPSLSGALAIREGELETRSLPQPVRDLHASVRLSRDRVFLDQLRATLGYTGRIQAFGGATFGPDFQPRALTLQASAREVAVRAPGMELVANADLTLQGRPGASRLDGQIKVLEGEYTRDVDLTGGIAARRVGAPRRASALENPLLRDLALRVQVLVPDQFRVRNNVARAELRGDVLVLGTAARPVAVGRAEATEGEVTFQDRVYKLEEATVDLIDPNRLVPYMHVVATSTIQGVEVRVQANGTPEQLKLDLSSTPAMSQTDVLALIATGQTPEQLREGGGGGLATASNLLLNQVAGGVARGIADRGVVDVLQIRPGSADSSQPGGGSFTVGKRLNEKLTITYTQDIAAPPGRTPGRVMIFDYLLTDTVVLKLEQDLGGGFNASARYRIPLR